MGFLLVIIELFARCYGWGAMSEYQLGVNISVEGWVNLAQNFR